MNKIVVAIDFSDCSINAFLHAVTIAEHCNGELILLWVQRSAGEKEKFEPKIADPTKDVEKGFEELIAKYQPEHPGVKMTWKIRKGKIYKEVTDEAKSHKAMLIVTGTHGASGFEEFWIGSNANKIISSSYCPVITIRGGINIRRPLKKIVLPIDSAEETRQKASFTGYLAKSHGAEVYILKLYTTKLKTMRQRVDIYAAQVATYLDEEKITYHVDQAECENIADQTIEYASSIEANLIAIMTEQETTTANIFLGPYAHQVVNHSPFPVLSIHPKNTLATGAGF
ncbi:MAG TPA: universal stress protein [Bacteroidales bacterium]|nr:universal stress protein [Bacteroidales bacterium]